MSIAKQVVSHLPYLRRYARALAGSQKAGDAYVIQVLETLVADPSAFDRTLPSRVALYKLFTALWSSVPVNGEGSAASASMADKRLEQLTPMSRQAFLLTVMEQFDERDAASVLGVTPEELHALIAASNREIARQVATDVLIIEDEPLIAMDLEAIMLEAGHRIVGIARTHKEALELARGKPVGLVLADIQLADGSSGIDAVNDLIAFVEAPVIFITAFPERLLTGQRAEPTYLITKPFQASLVTALSSQALFFGERAEKAA